MLADIKVINLERSIERKNNFVKNNKGIDYEFVSAVDGQLLTDNDIYDKNKFIQPLPYFGVGAYGCALSHLKLWNTAIEHEAPITIAEDDAIFRLDFKIKADEIISQLPTDWDIILWGWNFDSILSLSAMTNISPTVILFDQDTLRSNVEYFKINKTKSYAFKLDKCFGIPAYTISSKGAEKFKKLCFPLENFELFFPVLNRKIPNTGIDIAMNRVYASTNSFVSFPPLVITKNEHEISTIQKNL